jgi:hypothetical protein
VKSNLYHDPFFVDLQEGSVREHHQLHPCYAAASGARAIVDPEVLSGLRTFFEGFIELNVFSPMISHIRGLCTGVQV